MLLVIVCRMMVDCADLLTVAERTQVDGGVAMRSVESIGEMDEMLGEKAGLSSVDCSILGRGAKRE